MKTRKHTNKSKTLVHCWLKLFIIWQKDNISVKHPYTHIVHIFKFLYVYVQHILYGKYIRWWRGVVFLGGCALNAYVIFFFLKKKKFNFFNFFNVKIFTFKVPFFSFFFFFLTLKESNREPGTSSQFPIQTLAPDSTL